MAKGEEFVRFFIKLLCAVIILSALCGMNGLGARELLVPPTVSGQSGVLMDQYGQVLYQKDADRRMPMASTTKIMTALVAIEAMEAGEVPPTVKIAPAAVGVEGSSVYLMAGEEMEFTTLLYALMLESANDAATAIAIAIDGSVARFAERMNAKAKALGLSDTHFVNPHGLDDEAHYTTARELATITRAALANERFAAIVATGRYTAPVKGSEEERIRLFVNHNRLLREYEGCIGVKTGFTKRCGRCLVSAAKREGLTLIAVTLNAPDDWRDHRALLDYGFSLCTSVTVADADALRFTLPVIGGQQSQVECTADQPILLTLPKGSAPQLCIQLPRQVWGEVRAGAVMGRAVVTVNGVVAAEVPLTARTDVQAKTYPRSFWQKIGDCFAAIGRWIAGLFDGE